MWASGGGRAPPPQRPVRPNMAAPVAMALERLRNASLITDQRDIVAELKVGELILRHSIASSVCGVGANASLTTYPTSLLLTHHSTPRASPRRTPRTW